MRKLRIFLLIAAACSVLVASIAYAVPQTRYNFTVVDEDGVAVSAVIVQVYNPGTTTAATLYSNYNGTDSTTATIASTNGDVGFYGGFTTYDLLIYDTPLTTKIKMSGVTPLKHKILFPKLATYANINTLPQINFGALKTLVDSDTQPVVIGSFYKTGTTTATINNFCSGANGSEDALSAGQILVVQSKGAITLDVTSSGIIGGTTDIITAAGDVTTFVYDGTSWNVVARMDLSDDLN